jgi:hypothetical protein
MKRLMLFAFAVITTFTALASERIVFGVTEIDPVTTGNGRPKSPIQPPTVYIEDYVLTFTENHPDYTLYIKDEDGFVVYSTTVWSSDTEVILPSTLSGDYEIDLVMGNWLFTGFINL